jgi:pyruvate formate lyase activating enzyme
MVVSLALDPLLKIPLCAFHPGRRILSVGTFGCNLSCSFCQNWQISQREVPGRYISPVELLRLARDTLQEGNIGVAFTYNEPSIWFEYVRDCARLLHEAGLSVVLVTNGFLSREPLLELLPHVDAMNVDIKAFQSLPGFYQTLCKGRLEPVLETVRLAHVSCHVEITTLVIPGYNDSEEEIDALASWLASLSKHIPLHLTRHHPDWLMQQPAPISVSQLEKLAHTASRHLDTVIMGNV